MHNPMTLMTMIKNVTLIVAVIIICLISVSCKKDSSNPISSVPISNHHKPKLFPYGIWENVSYNYAYEYFNYDSSSSQVIIGGDEGYNFRNQSMFTIKSDSTCVYIDEGAGTYEKWLWYEYGQSGDTLILSTDSLFLKPMKFIQKPSLKVWVETIPRAEYWRYPNITDGVSSLAYEDSMWYVLTTGIGEGHSVLHCIKYAGNNVKTFSFPNARSMDVANGYLWLSDRNHIEKRHLNDTSLIEKFDLTDNIRLRSNNQEGWIQGISVANNKVYVSAAWEHFLILSTDGVLLDTGSSYTGLRDLAVYDNQVWGVTTTDKFFEIDAATKYALHSYLIVYPNLGRYQGIAIKDNKIACADNWYNYLRIYEVEKPQIQYSMVQTHWSFPKGVNKRAPFKNMRVQTR